MSYRNTGNSGLIHIPAMFSRSRFPRGESAVLNPIKTLKIKSHDMLAKTRIRFQLRKALNHSCTQPNPYSCDPGKSPRLLRRSESGQSLKLDGPAPANN